MPREVSERMEEDIIQYHGDKVDHILQSIPVSVLVNKRMVNEHHTEIRKATKTIQGMAKGKAMIQQTKSVV